MEDDVADARTIDYQKNAALKSIEDLRETGVGVDRQFNIKRRDVRVR